MITGTAIFGGEREEYRYTLTRVLQHAPVKRLLFIMLNPSTATADKSDPTITRCIGYARRWGYHQLMIGNLFAYRSTDPKELSLAIARGVDIVGPKNDEHLVELVSLADRVICAWGTGGGLIRRGKTVQRLLKEHAAEPYCLGATKFGEPKHPLYLRGDLDPIRFPVVSTAVTTESHAPVEPEAP